MLTLEIGQELEFIEPTTVEGQVIEKGTRVRVGHIMSEIQEADVTLVVLNKTPVKTLIVPRRVVTLHCRAVPAQR